MRLVSKDLGDAVRQALRFSVDGRVKRLIRVKGLWYAEVQV